MKELKKIGILFVSFILLAGFGEYARADHERVVANDKGTYMRSFVVTPSSTSGTAVLSVSAKRMDAILFNNSPVIVWLGTTSATQDNQLHENIRIGMPILSSATFSLGGKWTGGLFATCDVGQTLCPIHVLEGLNR